ncbi:MAG: hypothetical protein JST80_12455 [Bdellovibrionales bacterium]|nr:hypothetical protein [Bdellovibrionales bacterium]
MKILLLPLVATVSSIAVSQAQNFAEPKFTAPAIPYTSGVYNKSVDQLGCKQISKNSKSLHRCEFTTEAGTGRMNTLALSGTFSEIAYQHGLLLAQEVEGGSLNEALENINALKVRFKSKTILDTVDALLSCYTNRVKRSVDSEFQAATDALAQGYLEGMKRAGKPAKYSLADIEQATYSIELGNIFGTMFENLKSSKAKTISRVVGECGKPAIKAFLKTGLKELSKQIDGRSIVKSDFACTGAVIPASASKDGFLYHARNLEQTSMIETWNRNPVTFLIHETGYQKYVAFGTAGLIFPGGISGYNEAGIAVSTHQMEGTTYATAKKDSADIGKYAMGPYIQQVILREAKSIDDAVAIAKRFKRFSAWTILISDANKNESASIEFTSEGVDVSRRRVQQPMGQSNYYFLPKNQELQFHENYNSWLENFSRVKIVETVLNRARSGIEDILSLLASHVDWFEGERSFGRSVARPMNIMSTIVSPLQNRVWVTVSDRMPSAQGHYIEMKVDFAKMTLTPVGAIRTKDYESAQDWENSFSEFQLAYRANHADDSVGALAHLRRALAMSNCEIKAKQNAPCQVYDDPAYRYLIARFLLKEGKYSEAISEFNHVLSFNRNLHPLKIANIKSFLLYANDKLDGCKSAGKSTCAQYYKDADAVYATILKGSPGSAYFPLGPGNVVLVKADIKKKTEFISNVLLHKKKNKLPGIDMRSMD